MTYQETCEYLYNAMPMFERQGASGYKEGLENSNKLDEHFGKPHQKYMTIHVAGTNMVKDRVPILLLLSCKCVDTR